MEYEKITKIGTETFTYQGKPNCSFASGKYWNGNNLLYIRDEFMKNIASCSVHGNPLKSDWIRVWDFIGCNHNIQDFLYEQGIIEKNALFYESDGVTTPHVAIYALTAKGKELFE